MRPLLEFLDCGQEGRSLVAELLPRRYLDFDYLDVIRSAVVRGDRVVEGAYARLDGRQSGGCFSVNCHCVPLVCAQKRERIKVIASERLARSPACRSISVTSLQGRVSDILRVLPPRLPVCFAGLPALRLLVTLGHQTGQAPAMLALVPPGRGAACNADLALRRIRRPIMQE